MNHVADAEELILLGISLAIGLLIGVERGWTLREAKDGERIAGLRTYGLIALLGCVAGLLSQFLSLAVFGVIFLGFTAAATVAYAMRWRTHGDSSITSLITMLLTFVLGSLVALEHINLAASAAVVTAILLRLKDTLHDWLRKLGRQELHAALLLLLISVVLLPILPDRGYGPWQALNPYEAWWMVVLIASISFVGYFTMKIAGAGKGIILTAMAAGLVSSTALTLNFARLSKRQHKVKNLLACGILIACGTMFPRILLISTLINTAMLGELIIPMSVMTLVTLFAAVIIWHKNGDSPPDQLIQVINPLELKQALIFGGLLVLVILLGKAASHYFGETGLYLLALLSGIADVDAINLTLSRMSITELNPDVAVLGIVIASASNTLVKACLAVFVGGTGLGVRVFVPLFITAGVGLATAWLL